jgi:microcystin-dependent protein
MVTISAPSGFLECDGAAVSRSTYAALFAVVRYNIRELEMVLLLLTYPDLADNVAVGKSNNKALGTTGGANTVTPTGNVAGSTANATLSTAQLASHSHPGGGSFNIAVNGTGPGPGLAGGNNAGTGNAGSGQGHSHNMSANFAGDANSVLQPYLTLIYIIKT